MAMSITLSFVQLFLIRRIFPHSKWDSQRNLCWNLWLRKFPKNRFVMKTRFHRGAIIIARLRLDSSSQIASLHANLRQFLSSRIYILIRKLVCSPWSSWWRLPMWCTITSDNNVLLTLRWLLNWSMGFFCYNWNLSLDDFPGLVSWFRRKLTLFGSRHEATSMNLTT